MSLPELFLKRLQSILPSKRLEQALQSFAHEKMICFRINTLLANEEQVLQSLQQAQISFLPLPSLNAFYIQPELKEKLLLSSAFLNHFIYIQNPSSMLPPLLLNPQPGENILDLTAAPGSKTLQIAALMKNQGRIAAVEKVRDRFFHLQKNLKEHGATIVKTYLKDGSLVWRHCENQFDRVLLDAPCSSESRFCINNPETFAFWSEKKIRDMQHKQEKLLYSAIKCLKPGGTLVYSTCSFAPEENETVVNKMLKKFPEIKLEDLSVIANHINDLVYQTGLTAWENKSFDPSLAFTLRILPDQLFDGFYIAKFIK